MRKALYMFGLLADADIEVMARLGKKRRLTAGDVLIAQDQVLDRVFLLLDGHMEVSVRDIGVVATLASGEVLGEMSFVDSAPTSATVRALDAVSVLELRKDDLEARFASDPAFGMRFFRAISVFLAERMRSTIARLGYGKGASLDSDQLLEDELDEGLLDNVSLAGERFSRLMRLLADTRES